MKKYLRKIAAFIIYYSGLINLLGKREKKAVILAYHRICDNEQIDKGYVPGMSVRPKTFGKHLIYLERHFQVVPLEKLISQLEKGQDIDNECVITFDDGWIDNYLNAYPILKKYKFPGTIFLISDFVGSKKYMWFEKVARAIWKEEGERNEKVPDLSNYPYLRRISFFEIYSDSQAKIEDKIDAIIRRMKGLNRSEIIEAIDEIYRFFNSRIPSESPDQLFLSWEQIKEMEGDNISFGSHTASHVDLTLERFEDVRQELADSKKNIEDKLNKGAKTFCYPYGNYSDQVKEAVKKAGYIGATTYDQGFISRGSDPYLMARIPMHEDICSSVAVFACRVEGVPFF